MKTIALIVALSACSKGKFGGDGDECQQITEKTKPVMKEMLAAAGKAASDVDFAKLTEECRKRVKSGNGLDEDSKCITAATDEAGVRKCFEVGLKDVDRTEADITLHFAAARAAMAFTANNNAYVTGKAGPTPATPCCAQPDHFCTDSPDEWAQSPIWSALKILPSRSTHYQLTYESTDPKSFVMTPIGDPDCDGHPVTLTIHGGVGANGQPINDQPK
jgi:hypothetical protein